MKDVEWREECGGCERDGREMGEPYIKSRTEEKE